MNRSRLLWLMFCLTLLLVLPDSHWMESFEWRNYDFCMRHAPKVAPFPGLVLVEIDSKSITQERPWPFAPALYSDFLKQVEKGKPKAVVFDIDLEASPQISEKEYRQLVQEIKSYGNILFSLSMQTNGGIKPPRPDLEKNVLAFGFSSIYQDPDLKVRRVPLLFPYEGAEVPSLPLVAAGAYFGYLKKARPVFRSDGTFDWFLPETSSFASKTFTPLIPLNDRPETLGWLGLTIPKASNQPDLLINYESNLRSNVIPFWKVIQKEVSPDLFRSKLVFLHLSSDISDSYYTPLQTRLTPEEKIPGGEILAYATETILSHRFITRAPKFLEMTMTVIGLLVFLLILLRFGIFNGLYFFLLVLGCVTLGFYWFWHAHLWIGTTKLLFGSVALYAGAILIESIRFIKAVAHLLPEKMAKGIETGKKITVGGKEVSGTAMFVDMAGYTSLAEKSSLQKTFETLQRFHEMVEQCVKPYGGVVCDWQGDGVLVFFSADSSTPSPTSNPEQNALLSALKLKTHAKEEACSLGIGIASGQVLWGFLGTSGKAQPSCIGDPVNLASRLQGVGKESGSIIAVDSGTHEPAQGLFQWEELGLKPVKGKKDPILVFTPLQFIKEK